MTIINSISELITLERKNQYKKNHKFIYDFIPIYDRLPNHKIEEYIKSD